jgi:hypothetical protein
MGNLAQTPHFFDTMNVPVIKIKTHRFHDRHLITPYGLERVKHALRI